MAKRKPSKKQQYYLDRDRLLKEQYAKYGSTAVTARDEVKKLARQKKAIDRTIHRLKRTVAESHEDVQKEFRLANQIREKRELMYNLEHEVRTMRGYIEVEGRRVDVVNEVLTEDQESVLNRLEHQLEEYSIGDTHITKFYHKYQFNNISRETLTLYARGEGLI